MKITFGDFFVFVIMSGPLLGLIIYLIKAMVSNLKNPDEVNPQSASKLKAFKNNTIVSLLMFLTLAFLILITTVCFFPTILESIPLIWRIIGMFLFVIYYFCIGGIFIGLGNAVGAGSGSATKIINQIWKDITSQKK